MCRWLAYSGQPTYLEELLYKPEHSLVEQSLHAVEAKTLTNGDGFGIGWYGARPTPGIYHDIFPAWNDSNLKSLSQHVKSPLFFAHIRASTGTETSRANCHPFGYEECLFMHNGQIGGYEKIKRKIENIVPDHLYRHRKGTTDSEIIFLILLANGFRENPLQATRETIGKINAIMKKSGIKSALRIAACFSNGIDIWAIRYASDDKPPTLYASLDANKLIILSEPIDASDGWQALPANSLTHGRFGSSLNIATIF